MHARDALVARAQGRAQVARTVTPSRTSRRVRSLSPATPRTVSIAASAGTEVIRSAGICRSPTGCCGSVRELVISSESSLLISPSRSDSSTRDVRRSD
ncbi:hypothetical protein AQJ27_02075 [Streptomyces olivochromogenes]|nr:hypothetical protein AQJ27_02075 [Streptomyces olivochromogenes]